MFRWPQSFGHIVSGMYVLHTVPLPTTRMKPMYFDHTDGRGGNDLKPSRSAQTATYFSPNYEATHHWKTSRAASCKFQCHRSSWAWRPSNVRLKPWTMTAEQNERSLWLTFKHQHTATDPCLFQKIQRGVKFTVVYYLYLYCLLWHRKKYFLLHLYCSNLSTLTIFFLIL